jgi:peptidyl-prolyl cis-trans isomerase A (cyclophilin A)
MHLFRLLPCALAAGILLAQAPTAPAPGAAKEPTSPAREPGLYATLQTSKGPIVVKLFEKESPITVKNFIDLALGRKAWKDPKTGQMTRRPLYNGTIFHRVIPGFMIQGGDPLGTGLGGTANIPDEFHPSLKFDVPGRLAMANAGPGTGSSQFFLTEVPTPHLNGLHTIFGQVVQGQELIGQIARVAKGANDKPTTPVVLTRVTFQREGPGPAVGGPAPKKAAPGAKPATPGAKPAVPATKKTTPAAKPAAPTSGAKPTPKKTEPAKTTP